MVVVIKIDDAPEPEALKGLLIKVVMAVRPLTGLYKACNKLFKAVLSWSITHGHIDRATRALNNCKGNRSLTVAIIIGCRHATGVQLQTADNPPDIEIGVQVFQLVKIHPPRHVLPLLHDAIVHTEATPHSVVEGCRRMDLAALCFVPPPVCTLAIHATIAREAAPCTR